MPQLIFGNGDRITAVANDKKQQEYCYTLEIIVVMILIEKNLHKGAVDSSMPQMRNIHNRVLVSSNI